MIVEGGEITEKNPMSKMVTGPVLNVKTTILLGAINAIAAMPLRAMRVATVVHVVIIVVATEEVVGFVWLGHPQRIPEVERPPLTDYVQRLP